MTTPPRKLRSALEPGECYQLRTETGLAVGKIEYAVAMRRAVRGDIEGVCSASGKIRYLRELPESAREMPDLEAEQEIERGKASSIGAHTNLGAYRQHLESGSVWALCLCRSIDGARA